MTRLCARAVRLGLVLVFLLPLNSFATGADWAAYAVRPIAKLRIQDMELGPTPLPVKLRVFGDVTRPEARVEILVRGEGRTLWHKGRQLPGSRGRYAILVPLDGTTSKVTLTVKSADGSQQTESFLIHFESYKAQEVYTRSAPVKRDFLVVSSGASWTSYRETGKPDYRMLGWTVKASYQRLLFPPYWDCAFSAYITALPIAPSPSGSSARFLGVNGRFGYVLPFVTAPWRVSLLGGWYYTTMFVSPRTFGFHNMQGPQLFPSVSYTFGNGDSLASYFKFSPIVVNGGIAPGQTRELATGLTFSHLLGSGHPLSVSLDASTIRLSVGRSTVTSATGGLAIGYGL